MLTATIVSLLMATLLSLEVQLAAFLVSWVALSRFTSNVSAGFIDNHSCHGLRRCASPARAMTSKDCSRHDGNRRTSSAWGKSENFYAAEIARTMLCDPHGKSLSRTLREMRLAWQIRLRFSVEEQRIIYLNRAYFSRDASEAYSAAAIYFNKKPSALTTAQAALLMSSIQNPTGYSPMRRPERALARRNRTLETMRDAGLLNKEEKETAMASPLKSGPS